MMEWGVKPSNRSGKNRSLISELLYVNNEWLMMFTNAWENIEKKYRDQILVINRVFVAPPNFNPPPHTHTHTHTHTHLTNNL